MKFNVGIDLELAIKGMIQAYGDAIVADGTGKQLYHVVGALEDEIIYIDFDGLKLSINQKNLREILVTVMSILGIDSSSIPWLNAVDEEFKFVPSNLTDIVPVLQMDSLGMLAIIQSMSLENNVFRIQLKGDMISAGADKPMFVEIVFDDDSIGSISLTNIYTGVTNGEYFSLNINFNQYTGVRSVEKVDANNNPLYIDTTIECYLEIKKL